MGGGNSAGQAALFLSRSTAEVHLIIRGETLGSSMSRYLIDQIERDPLPSGHTSRRWGFATKWPNGPVDLEPDSWEAQA